MHGRRGTYIPDSAEADVKLSRGKNTREIQRDAVMTNQEIAEELGITVSQVRYLMQNGMRKLKMKAMARGMRFEEYFE